MIPFKRFITEMSKPDYLSTNWDHLNSFVAGLRAHTHDKPVRFGPVSKSLKEVSLSLPGRTGASRGPGDRNHESNDHHVSHVLAHPGGTVALVHREDGEHTATHVYDHKTNKFHKIHNGDADDAIEINEDGSSGGVRGLKIKGSSNKVKEAAGQFVHHPTNNPHPNHPDAKKHGIRRVLEINGATHHLGKERDEHLDGDEHEAHFRAANKARKADAAKPRSMTNHPSMNAASEEDKSFHKKIEERGRAIGKEYPQITQRIKSGYKKHSAKLSDPDYDPRKDGSANAARKAHKEHAQSYGYKAESAPKILGGNTKIEKNESQRDDKTVGMSLAPSATHGVPGHNACSTSSTECRGVACLGFATGKNAMLSNMSSKATKHHFLMLHPHHHAAQLHAELLSHVDRVHKHNQAVEAGTAPADKKTGKPAKKTNASWRPNMYSDYTPDTLQLHEIHKHVRAYAAKRGIDFKTRDYTKNVAEVTKPRPKGYHMAYSSTGPSVIGGKSRAD